MYDGIVDRLFAGKNIIAQMGQVWQYGQGESNWGTHYFMFGDAGELIGEVNGRLTITGGNVSHSKKDANRLIEAGWNLLSAQPSLTSSLERCILTLERAKPSIRE